MSWNNSLLRFNIFVFKIRTIYTVGIRMKMALQLLVWAATVKLVRVSLLQRMAGGSKLNYELWINKDWKKLARCKNVGTTTVRLIFFSINLYFWCNKQKLEEKELAKNFSKHATNFHSLTIRRFIPQWHGIRDYSRVCCYSSLDSILGFIILFF